MQQPCLAVLEATDHEDVEKRRDVGFTNTSSLFEVHVLRNRNQVASIGRSVFRVATSAHQAHHSIANVPTLDLWAKFFDCPGDFKPKYF